MFGVRRASPFLWFVVVRPFVQGRNKYWCAKSKSQTVKMFGADGLAFGGGLHSAMSPLAGRVRIGSSATRVLSLQDLCFLFALLLSLSLCKLDLPPRGLEQTATGGSNT